MSGDGRSSLSERQSVRDSLAQNPAIAANMVVTARRNKKMAQETFVFVEGAGDRNAYYTFAGDSTSIIVAGCRANVEQCVRLAEAQRANGVFGIEDADCDRALGKPKSSSRVCVTDGHDLEAMMMRSPALEKVLRELGDHDLVVDFEREHKPVRTALLAAARPLGVAKYLKFKSELRGVVIGSRELSFEAFIDPKNLEVRPSALYDQLAALSDGRTSRSEIEQLIESTDLSQVDEWDVCRGHDLVAILSIGLSGGAFGTRKVTAQAVERSLRLAFDTISFCRTRLCTDITASEANDPEGYLVLSDEVRLVQSSLRDSQSTRP